MKSWLYAAMVVFAMGFVACGGDDNDSIDGAIDPNKGSDNLTDLAVTGGVENFMLDDDDYIIALLTGYLNLTDEMKTAVGMGTFTGMYGVEFSTEKSMPVGRTRQVKGNHLSDRKFYVDISGLQEKTQYYYRTFFGAGGTFLYGNIESFTTPTLIEALGNLETLDVNSDVVGENYAYITAGGLNNIQTKKRKVVYSTDKAMLTEENIRNEKVDFFYGGKLEGLEEGTTYYYRVVRFVKDVLVMGEIKSFTTKGISVKELAKYVTANITYDETTYTWNATITSSLANQFPGKNIEYAINAHLTTDYPIPSGAEEIIITWDAKTGGRVKATGSGNKYTAEVKSPQYWATTAKYNSFFEEYLEPNSEETFLDILFALDSYRELKERIDNGVATNKEKNVYEAIAAKIEQAYGKELYKYVHSYLDIIVTIDYKDYVVKTQECKLRLPWDIYYEEKSNNSGDGDGKKEML